MELIPLQLLLPLSSITTFYFILQETSLHVSFKITNLLDFCLMKLLYKYIKALKNGFKSQYHKDIILIYCIMAKFCDVFKFLKPNLFLWCLNFVKPNLLMRFYFCIFLTLYYKYKFINIPKTILHDFILLVITKLAK